MVEGKNAGDSSDTCPQRFIGLEEFQLAIFGGMLSSRARLRFTNRGQQ